MLACLTKRFSPSKDRYVYGVISPKPALLDKNEVYDWKNIPFEKIPLKLEILENTTWCGRKKKAEAYLRHLNGVNMKTTEGLNALLHERAEEFPILGAW